MRILTNSILLVLLIHSILPAQNKAEYFKVYPVIDDEMPVWATEMYSPDPNVYEVHDLYIKYMEVHGFNKSIHTQNFKHWVRMVNEHLNTEGFIRPMNSKEREAFLTNLATKRNGNQKNTTSWKPLGPFETYVQGTTVPYSIQTNVYAIDIHPQNTDILICGSETGTVFYSNDKGLNWTTISDHAIFGGGVTAVKIHPEDPQHFFVGVDAHIYETKDGGLSWIENFFLDGTANEFLFNPTDSDHIFCSSSSGLFESKNGGETWSKILNNSCYDIVVHPTDASIYYALMHNNAMVRCDFYKSTDSGQNWTLKENGWYIPEDQANASVNGGKIGVSPADPSRVYACLIGAAKADDNGWIGVYRSDDTGDNWYNPVGQDGGPYESINTTPWNVAAYSSGYHQGYYNFDLEISPSNADLMWIGTIRLSESSDGGYTFVSIGAANSTRLNNQHADIQDIEVINDEVWVASDGGINYSNDNEQSSESRKNGVNGADFWGFGSGWNEDVLVGGKYHNGNSAFFQSYTPGIFHHVGGVEESTGYVHPLDSRKAFFNKYWAGGTETVIIPDSLGGPAQYQGIIPYIPNESYTQSWSSGFYFDPRYADHIYMGEGSKVWKSENGGSYFEALHDFGTDRRVLEVKISRANPQMIYTVVGGPGYWDACEMFRSEDSGKSWTKMASLGTNMWRVELSLNPLNESEVWACANSGSNGNKVYRSVDKGQSWENKTSPELNGESFRDILYQGGTDGVVYVASQYSVKRYTSATNSWEDASEGLPFVPKGFEMRPFYRDQKIRIGTYGKGIWEADLETYSMPVAQPMTHNNNIYCARDTVQFDCYSILAHEDAQWSWTIEPEPVFVTNTEVRNPRVVFGTEGSYDVTLKITDKMGNTSEKKIANMVEIQNYCSLDTVPGLALRTYEDGDFAQIGDLNTSVDHFTVSAWVKPEGIQPDYSGIFMNDGDTGGFNFKNGDNSLAYHWPGGQWWWNSGLIVPEGEWSHVAMVVTPDSVTLYLNGIPSTHVIETQPCLLGTAKIGSYKAWGGRNYNGMIDEVALWSRALSTDEIRAFRHLTKEDFQDDPEFLAYYQFNSPTTEVLDRISSNHASLSGGADKVDSEGPFGGGVSSSQTIQNFGLFDFAEVEASMIFDGGLLPGGPVYLSRIHLKPNETPNADEGPGVYWILNNYGENEIFDAAGQLRITSPFYSPNQQQIDDPSLVRLYSRMENSDEASWNEFCEANGADAAGFSFGPDCEISFAGQFYYTVEEGDTTSSVNPEELEFLPVVYPNPMRGGNDLLLKNRMQQDFEFELMTSKGERVIKTLIPAGARQEIRVDKLSTGLYFYRFRSEDKIIPGKLVVE